MIKSMTGYGKSVADSKGKRISIEIKSLNSKQLDLNLKIPWLYKEKEAEIRNAISQRLGRGKIDLSISFDILDADVIPTINKTVIKNYFSQLKELSGELGLKSDGQLLAAILRFPDALRSEKPELADGEWNLVKNKLSESIEQVDSYRTEEGKSLEADLIRCTGKILNFLGEIEKFENGRIEKIKEKLNSSLMENVGSENIDMNRFEQELIFYLEKMDINEEKVRLKKHCEYLQEKIATEPPNGKILGFISQEIGREINTIGSKANDASIQKLVVMMKDELEKIKEQSLNIL